MPRPFQALGLDESPRGVMIVRGSGSQWAFAEEYGPDVGEARARGGAEGSGEGASTGGEPRSQASRKSATLAV